MKKIGQTKLATVVATLCLLFDTAGCSYALPIANPPSAERVRVVARTPELFVVHVDVGHTMDYAVPADGRVTVGVPAYRRGCSVYLFNLAKVSNGADPLKDWTLTVSSGGKVVRTLSLRQVSRLSVDSEGFRLLKIPD